MFIRLVKSIYLLASISSVLCSSESANNDLIKSLPNYKGPELKFKQYSGYLNVSNGNSLFYWLTMSSGKQSDPVVLWLSGGPGCSSSFALMTEMGPYRTIDGGQSITNNPTSWNQYAHMIFLDAPAGVGYSINRNNHYNFTDTETANDNVKALVQFFAKFPELKSNDLYITGESYGGTYVPMLGSLLTRMSTQFPTFKGIVVGNGCLNEKLRYNSQIPFNLYHDFISQEDYNSAIKSCCKSGSAENCDWYSLSKKTGSTCQKIADNLEGANFWSGVDPYFIYYNCYFNGTSEKRSTIHNTYFKFRRNALESNNKTCLHQNDPVTYLNQKAVKQALHVSPDVRFNMCSDNISESYIVEYEDMTPFVLNIVSGSKRRALFFNGDIDSVCSFIHNQQFIEQLGLPLLHKREAWNYANKVPTVSGWFTDVDFVTVVGGGHFPAADTQKPKETLQMFVNYLRSQNYSNPI